MGTESVDLIGLATGPEDDRAALISAATPARLKELSSEITQLLACVEETQRACQAFRREIQSAIDENGQREAKELRRRRSKAKGPTLAAYLTTQEAVGTEMRLEDLLLCTRTGARVCLEALDFDGAGEFEGEKNVVLLSRVRALIHEGRIPCASWHLHYVDEKGTRTNGFSWDRDFLHELFVVLGQ